MNARETAAWLRVLTTRDKATLTRLNQVADWMEKATEVTLAEVSVEELFREVVKRSTAAILVVTGEHGKEERSVVLHAGPRAACIGLASLSHEYLLGKIVRMKRERWDE